MATPKSNLVTRVLIPADGAFAGCPPIKIDLPKDPFGPFPASQGQRRVVHISEDDVHTINDANGVLDLSDSATVAHDDALPLPALLALLAPGHGAAPPANVEVVSVVRTRPVVYWAGIRPGNKLLLLFALLLPLLLHLHSSNLRTTTAGWLCRWKNERKDERSDSNNSNDTIRSIPIPTAPSDALPHLTSAISCVSASLATLLDLSAKMMGARALHYLPPAPLKPSSSLGQAGRAASEAWDTALAHSLHDRRESLCKMALAGWDPLYPDTWHRELTADRPYWDDAPTYYTPSTGPAPLSEARVRWARRTHFLCHYLRRVSIGTGPAFGISTAKHMADTGLPDIDTFVPRTCECWMANTGQSCHVALYIMAEELVGRLANHVQQAAAVVDDAAGALEDDPGHWNHVPRVDGPSTPSTLSSSSSSSSTSSSSNNKNGTRVWNSLLAALNHSTSIVANHIQRDILGPPPEKLSPFGYTLGNFQCVVSEMQRSIDAARVPEMLLLLSLDEMVAAEEDRVIAQQQQRKQRAEDTAEMEANLGTSWTWWWQASKDDDVDEGEDDSKPKKAQQAEPEEPIPEPVFKTHMRALTSLFPERQELRDDLAALKAHIDEYVAHARSHTTPALDHLDSLMAGSVVATEEDTAPAAPVVVSDHARRQLRRTMETWLGLKEGGVLKEVLGRVADSYRATLKEAEGRWQAYEGRGYAWDDAWFY